jgi:hypothetical protein
VPVAVAIWVASFLAVPLAVLVHDAVTPDVTAVQNAADEHGDDTRPADDGATAVVDGVSVEADADADADAQDTDPQDPAPGDDPSVPADATGGTAEQPTTQGEAPAAVPDQTGPVVAVPVVTVPAVPGVAAPSTVSAAGRGTPAPVTTSPAPTTTTEPAPRPEPTEPELGAALAPSTGP